MYIALGFASAHLFSVDAYPPRKPMQLYTQREFNIFGFFVLSTAILVTLYLGLSYKVVGATFGQNLLNIRLLNQDGRELSNKNIVLRIVVVLFRLFLVAIPGPLVALLFFAFSAHYLNEAFSFVLLLSVVLGLFYRALVKYKNGQTRSIGDKFSGVLCVDISKQKPEVGDAGQTAEPGASDSIGYKK
jgi:hypothetical protein